jgi:hypothetical protein
MKVAWFIIIVILFFAAFSCKDELTLPAKVSFKFGMEPYYAEENGTDQKIYASNPNKYTIDKGQLVIEAIEFDGRRDQGKDVYFISDFSQKVESVLNTETSSIEVEFDIPQGVYNRIDVTLHLGNNGNSPLILEGTFNFGPFTELPIRFEYGYADVITVRAKPKSGSNIVLSKDNPSKVRVVIDSGFLFRFINPSVIANADRVNMNGIEVMLINSTNNINTFNQIANRFNNSISVIFE